MIKSNYIQELSDDLITRLPELEWKLTHLNPALFIKALPKNVFRTQDLTALACINELKVDLHALGRQRHERSAEYLAQHLKQKIFILVGICRVKKNKVANKTPDLSIKMLSTRQQWLQALEQEVEVLKKQKEAFNKCLLQIRPAKEDPSVLLNLRVELGALEKKLTLAEESLNKACQHNR